MSDGSEFLSDDRGKPMSCIASRLVDILGSRLCAVIGDVEQTSIVRAWIDGVEPTVGRARILRFALRVAETIEERYGRAAAQSWIQGANHALADKAPALVLKRASRVGEAKALSAERNIAQALRKFLDV